MTDRTAYYRARRDAERGGPPRDPAPCGTYAAYRRHERHGEQPCPACREAYNAEQRRRYQSRRKS